LIIEVLWFSIYEGELEPLRGEDLLLIPLVHSAVTHVFTEDHLVGAMKDLRWRIAVIVQKVHIFWTAKPVLGRISIGTKISNKREEHTHSLHMLMLLGSTPPKTTSITTHQHRPARHPPL